MEITEKKSAHQRGSVEWFIDQCGATMPSFNNVYIRGSKRLFNEDGKEVDFEMTSEYLSSKDAIERLKKLGVITERTWDHKEAIKICQENGTKVFTYHAGFVAVCDGNDVKLVHNFEGLMDMLQEAGYVNTSGPNAKVDEKHPILGVPGRNKDFYFEVKNGENFNNELEGAFARKSQLTPEVIKKLRAEFEAAQQMQ